MSNMVENGFSGGGPSLPPGESHDEFLELCALATTDWLSAQDRRRLGDHLAQCASCSDAMRQFEALVAHGIPADDVPAAQEDGRASGAPWSLDEAEVALFARLDREEAASPPRQSAGSDTTVVPGNSLPSRETIPPFDALWRHMWWQYAAGLILAVALGYSIYRTGIYRGAEVARLAAPSVRQPADSVRVPSMEAAASAAADRAALREQRTRVAALAAAIRKQSAQIAQLGAEKADLEKNLSSAEADHGSLEASHDDLARQLGAAQAQLEDTRRRLEATGAQDEADEVRVASLNRQIGDLNAGMEQKDQELSREQELLAHDSDIRELMGSRNLYIAEVYDVARNGETQRPFGRVFYTKGKSLIFYAYDLDQQPGLRESSTFQAWGRRGPDEDRAVNLGVFYIDNAAGKRWVLKTDNARTLANIDAVFVTIEPHGGSSHPSGKPLLFAYLRIEPNHP
jgi:hypothetical protein